MQAGWVDLTSLVGLEGSPGRGCVTGAPELQPRALDLRSRRSVRAAGHDAMKSAKEAGQKWAFRALLPGTWHGVTGGEEQRAAPKQPISEVASPHGPLEVVVHTFRPLPGQKPVLVQKCQVWEGYAVFLQLCI